MIIEITGSSPVLTTITTKQRKMKPRKKKYILLCLDCKAVYSRDYLCRSWCSKADKEARVKRLKVIKS